MITPFSNLRIRDAKPSDVALLVAAQRAIACVPGRLASQPHEISEAAMAERIARLSGSQQGAFVVIEADDEIRGHALLDPLKLAVTSHVVDLTIAVHEGAQGQGLGQRLLAHLIAWARAQPTIERIELRVRSANTPAIHLYKKMGFIEEGRMVKRIKIGPNTYFNDVVMGLWVGD